MSGTFAKEISQKTEQKTTHSPVSMGTTGVDRGTTLQVTYHSQSIQDTETTLPE